MKVIGNIPTVQPGNHVIIQSEYSKQARRRRYTIVVENTVNHEVSEVGRFQMYPDSTQDIYTLMEAWVAAGARISEVVGPHDHHRIALHKI